MHTPNHTPPYTRARQLRHPGKNTDVSEKDIEQYFRRKCKARGWLCLKFVSPGNRGVPDRIVLAGFGVTFWVEFKKPGEKPTKLQQAKHRDFAAIGHEVYVVDSFELADEMYRRVSVAVERRAEQ